MIEDRAHVFDLKRAQNKITYASYYSLDHSKIINTHLGVATTNNYQVYKKKLKNITNRCLRLGRWDN